MHGVVIVFAPLAGEEELARAVVALSRDKGKLARLLASELEVLCWLGLVFAVFDEGAVLAIACSMQILVPFLALGRRCPGSPDSSP